MELKFKREEKKHNLEDLKILEQDSITMVELFVKDNLDDTSQEVFYTELEGKEITTDNVKDALFQAVISNVSAGILKNVLTEYAENPEIYAAKAKEFLESESK